MVEERTNATREHLVGALTIHTFLLYFDRAIPDVLFKRAFGGEDLPRVRDLLGSRVKARQAVGARARLRIMLLTLLLGFVIVGLGILAGVLLR